MIGKKLAFACLFLVACGGKEQVRERRYQDLKGFFSNEVSRLEKQKTTVNKTVSRNGISENKVTFSPDWDTELALFSESDINKPAWSDSYSVHTDSNSTSYTALDNKLKTRSIRIRKNKKGKLIELTVLNSTTNYLYSSTEELLYIPDSLYRIVKKQEVVLLGKNNYEITGINNRGRKSEVGGMR